MTTKTVHRGLVRKACSGGWLIERRHQCLVGEEICVSALSCDRLEAVCDLEEVEELVPFEVLEREDVASGEAAHA
jgi:hypothetical protein